MSKKILFLLGSANISGGTYVIFQHALYLQSIGEDVTIALVFMTLPDFNTLKNSEACWHDAIKQLKFISIDEAIKNNHYDVVIFTWWATLYYLDKIQATTYLYFVQSIESRFYPDDKIFLRELVERTYKIGLPVITEATWIKEYLEKNYNNRCLLAKNGILKSLYTPTGECIANLSSHHLRILVEGPIEATYKNVAKTLQLCKEANVGEVWLLTSSAIQEHLHADRVFSQVPIYDVPKIYRSCDVLVKLSYVEGMFGPPLEMFHCGGTAIVYDVSGHDEYILHNQNALVAKTNDEAAVVDYLRLLNQDRTLLNRLKQGALETARIWIDWQHSSQDFATVLNEHCADQTPSSHVAHIQAATQIYLKEHISTTIWMQQHAQQQQFIADPVYQQSGAYALTLALEQGFTQFDIALGKKYRSVQLLLVGLIKKSKKTAEISIENLESALKLTVSQMINAQNSSIFECLSPFSAINVVIDQAALNHQEFHYYFQMQFNPLQLAV